MSGVDYKHYVCTILGGREDWRADRAEGTGPNTRKNRGRDGREVWGTVWRQSLLGAVPGGGHFLSLGTFLSQELGQKLVTG